MHFLPLLLTLVPFVLAKPVSRSSSDAEADVQAWNRTRMSYFEVPLAPLACGDIVTDTELVIEAGNYLFDQGIGCGQHVEIVAPNGKVAVGQLLDSCEGDNCFNTSPALFAHFEPTAKGYLYAYWRRTDKAVGKYPDVEPFYSGTPPDDTSAA